MANFTSPYLAIIITLLTSSSFGYHYEKFFEVNGGPKYMYYYTKFSVGNPDSLQSAIIDTGSDTLAFPCDHCQSHDCGTHEDPRFVSSESTTFKYEIHCPQHIFYHRHKVCQFVKQYAEGSTLLGFLGEDYIKFKNAKRVRDPKLDHFNSYLKKDLKLKAEFGCTTKETGLFKDQYADGIIGLDQHSGFIKSMEKYSSHKEAKVFSFGLCFHSNGGIMSIDLRNKFKEDDKIVMLNKSIANLKPPLEAEFSIDSNYYQIQVSKFSIWEGPSEHTNLVELKPINVMIDSGTTFTHLPDFYLSHILKKLSEYCKEKEERCGRVPDPVLNPNSCLELSQPDDFFKNETELLNSFPDIKLHLGEDKRPYVLRPKNYFYREYIEHPTEEEKNIIRLCLALKGKEKDRIILGAFGMIDYYFYFDRKVNKLKVFEEDCYVKSTQLLDKRVRILEEILPQELHLKIKKEPVLSVALLVTIAGAVISLYYFARKSKKSKELLQDSSHN